MRISIGSGFEAGCRISRASGGGVSATVGCIVDLIAARHGVGCRLSSRWL